MGKVTKSNKETAQEAAAPLRIVRAQSTGQTADQTAGPTTGPMAGPTHDQIAERAYQLFLARGKVDGGHVADWLAAEAELQKEPAR
ncbi:MAG: DUF2934 domain-containing protein [Deltaproteobacteria bacterium]|nr:DUF2934 domain-containing protein [Deltaproteobacteria bacterium]